MQLCNGVSGWKAGRVFALYSMAAAMAIVATTLQQPALCTAAADVSKQTQRFAESLNAPHCIKLCVRSMQDA